MDCSLTVSKWNVWNLFPEGNLFLSKRIETPCHGNCNTLVDCVDLQTDDANDDSFTREKASTSTRRRQRMTNIINEALIDGVSRDNLFTGNYCARACTSIPRSLYCFIQQATKRKPNAKSNNENYERSLMNVWINDIYHGYSVRMLVL